MRVTDNTKVLGGSELKYWDIVAGTQWVSVASANIILTGMDAHQIA